LKRLHATRQRIALKNGSDLSFPVVNVGTIKCPVTDQAANGVMGSETLGLDGGQFLATPHDLSSGRGLAVYIGQHAG
jgi:hypothetical protein